MHCNVELFTEQVFASCLGRCAPTAVADKAAALAIPGQLGDAAQHAHGWVSVRIQITHLSSLALSSLIASSAAELRWAVSYLQAEGLRVSNHAVHPNMTTSTLAVHEYAGQVANATVVAKHMHLCHGMGRRAFRSEIHRLTVPGASGGNLSEPATAPQLVWPHSMTCFTCAQRH